jgi:hypothetical protein
MRGPGQMLRVLALFVLVIPVVMIITASRLTGNGLAFAQAERR